MPAPGYYKINHRALRFREIVRMHGWRRAFRMYWASRSMPSAPGTWMPGLWATTECKREDLSEQFWLATRPHRKDFEELGFTECRFSKSDSLNPNKRDSGTARYLDATRRYFGLLLYLRTFHPAKRQEINEIIIAFTAVFENGSFSCTNTRKTFDGPDDGSEVIRLNSYDVKFIYQQFLDGLQKRQKRPREFPDLESLKQWFDTWQLKAFEDRVRRRLFVPMTEAEVAAARARLQSGAPPIPRPRRRLSLRWALWLAIVVFIFLLELMHGPLHRGGSGITDYRERSDTFEYQGQQFKMRKAYATYEDYKDDPNNLDTNELGRIEQAMTTAKVPPWFKDPEEFIHFMLDLKFPGYGMGGLGVTPRTDDGSTLIIESVEIPQREKERVIAVRQSGGKLITIDDFVYSPLTSRISAIKLENQTLRYYDGHKQLLREKRLNP
jgi:hypothetical protein